jgi:hypothetical protein
MKWRLWIVGLTVGCVVLIISAFLAESSILPQSDPFSSAQFWSAVWGVAFLIVTLGVCVISAEDEKDFFATFLLATTGAGLGWVIGILATPHGSDEAAVFGQYRTAIVGFLSGFAASKISRVWDLLTDSSKPDQPPKLFTRLYLTRVLVFACCFLISLAAQYNIRQYGSATIITSAAVGGTDSGLGDIYVHPCKTLQFTGLASYPKDSTVKWSINDSSAAQITPDGRLFFGNPEKLKNSKEIAVTARSEWNHSTEKTLKVHLIVDEDD